MQGLSVGTADGVGVGTATSSPKGELAQSLGSTRLEEPLSRFRVSLAHEQADRDRWPGTTAAGVRVDDVMLAWPIRSPGSDRPFPGLTLPFTARLSGSDKVAAVNKQRIAA